MSAGDFMLILYAEEPSVSSARRDADTILNEGLLALDTRQSFGWRAVGTDLDLN